VKTPSNTIKCIVIDDEPLAIEILEHYISQDSLLSLVAKFDNGIDALTYVKSDSVDLIFTDIQMPDISGIEFLKLLDKKVDVIFTSAYPEYALEGYDYNPLDFLIKPISMDKFMRAVGRAKVKSVAMNDVSDDSSTYFYIKANGKTIRLLLSEILYVEGLKDYVIFHTPTAKHISLQSMKELESKLSKKEFVRIHKSYIVEANKIEEVSGGHVKIKDKQIPIGRQYKPAFLKFIECKKL